MAALSGGARAGVCSKFDARAYHARVQRVFNKKH